jgi:glyoxylase-like metal-dependent hydrolase (beta-lactamase superfamily II)
LREGAFPRRWELSKRNPTEVFPGVYLVGGPGLTSSSDCLVYALDGQGEVALVDTGVGKSVGRILSNLEEVGLGGKPLGTVILTHCHVDHIGGVRGILQRARPRVVCHRGDLEAIETGEPGKTASSWYGIRLSRVKVDMVLEGEEEKVQVGSADLLCIHTPGHTPGSISILWERPQGRVLFGQDIHGPFMEEFGSDLAQWASSMRKLLALKADVLCEGHFGIFQPAREVERFILEQMRGNGF